MDKKVEREDGKKETKKKKGEKQKKLSTCYFSFSLILKASLDCKI